MIETLDTEKEQIRELGEKIMYKYKDKPFRMDILYDLQAEAIDRFHALGFVVNVDIGRCLRGFPPQIVIESRVEATEFDHDKMKYEIEKSRALGGT